MSLIGTLTEGTRPLDVLDDDLSGHCTAGRHERCAHRPGGAQDGGCLVRAVEGVPAHVWHCGCTCHRPAPLTVLSLFSGIGALDLGLERAGMTTVGQVELDPFCRSVLARHWPEVPRHDDVRTAPAWWARGARPRVDVVAGGFPCQPFSVCGRKRGVADERWGWPWMLDVVRTVRPRFVVVENVPGLLGDRDAFGWVLGDLAALGFDAEWSLLRACSVGAPHVRERLFLVAHADSVDGAPGLGAGPQLGESGQARGIPARVGRSAAARAWRHRVDRAVAASRTDGREVDGTAGRMVTAGGNAVVIDVAELVGRRVLSIAARGAA